METVSGSGVILDLDPVAEPRPDRRRRWFLPLAGATALAIVLVVSFVRVPTIRPVALGGPPAAAGFKVLELPAHVASAQTRVALSGITGLTQVAQNDGYRTLYRLPDGRPLILLQYPIRESDVALERLVAPAGFAMQPLTVRGVPARIELPADASGPTFTAVLIWIADGTLYQLSAPAILPPDLVRLADELR